MEAGMMQSILVPDDVNWAEYEDDTEVQSKVKPANSWMDQVAALFAGTSETIEGDTLPWSKTHHDFRLRSGELTVWAGVNGNGKSMLLGQVMIGLMLQQRKCLVASFEMQPRRTVHRMLRQASGTNRPSVDYQIDWQEWAAHRLWIYDHQGNVDTRRIYALCRYAAEIGVEHLVIDSMMKVIPKEDDMNLQKGLMDRLTGLARELNIHIHLVHHMRKRDDESRMGSKSDIKGSGIIADQADNLCLVWANAPKKEKRESGMEFDATEPDLVVRIAKQRNGEWEGKVALWFEQRSLQFVSSSNAGVMDMAPEFVRAAA